MISLISGKYKGKKILSVGDNLNTDIKGANLLNYDSLIISNGIHKKVSDLFVDFKLPLFKKSIYFPKWV